MAPAESADQAEPLTESERSAALAFLAERPLHSVILSGWLMDHGITSPKHRGTFYRSLDRHGNISGIAIIGRNTFFEVRTESALLSLARAARRHPEIKMVFGEHDRLNEFWKNYARPGQRVRMSSQELLFEIHQRPADADGDWRLNRASGSEMDQVVQAHAAMVLAETGIDPLAADNAGFRERCAARIRDGRVWVLMKDGELVFKTDVVSETPMAIYIEGLWVNPKFRERNVASNCVRSFCRTVLNGKNSVCGFVEADNLAAQSMYRKNGFNLLDPYEKIYL
jgi:ribosomal protein S18 acetylase RimI-like enzyme